jgi:hypothetical protein
VNLSIQRLILLFHPLQRFHGGIAARFGGSALRGEFIRLPLIARFALSLGLDEPALLHRFCGRGGKRQCGACEKPCYRDDEASGSDADHVLLSWFALVADLR